MAWVECTHVDYEWVHPLAIEYRKRTGSRQAQKIHELGGHPPRPQADQGAAAGRGRFAAGTSRRWARVRGKKSRKKKSASTEKGGCG
ncbi:MAG: hypothetical protein U0798_16860 [Gemmataceae bacterium]